jgi:Glycosyl hydrolase family 20, catalytic domain/beta-acetyl hexosaminidase like
MPSLHRYLASLLTIAVGANEKDKVNWEKPNSKIWPAIRGTDPTQLPNSLGLYSPYEGGWELHCPHDGCSDELVKMVDMGMGGFESSLEAFTPSSASDRPINPSNATLFPKEGVQISITTSNLTLFDADESYSIHVGGGKQIKINAKTVYGALHGITTLQQMFEFGWIDPETQDPIFTIPLLSETLVDKPAYAYRGLMIDTARHFLPLSLIEYTLQIMAANKLNVLHWHMTDSQSWPFLGMRFPELANKAAYCKTCVYTMDDIRRIQLVAQRQGIRVIPEFDLPGHSEGSFVS